MSDRRNMTNGSQAHAAETPRSGGWVRTSIEVVLLATGVILLAIFAAAQVERYLISHTLLKDFPASGLTAPAPAENPSLEPKTASDESRAAAVAEIVPGSPLAVLRIPSIRLDVPVLEGTDALTLNHAAGRIAGTALPGQAGNIGIAAHRDGFFRNLGKLRIGDPVELQTPSGVETYVVEQTQIVMPDNVSVLDPRPVPSLTLVTCYPFHYLGRAPQRYIVTALLERPAQGHAPTAP
ncbi:MAG TPA: class D sortase [Acidobacteriaceae bacterium]|nr:class D sortase [Acidobacteriaceae bacterium]